MTNKAQHTKGPWKVEPYKFSKRGSWVSHPASVQAADGHWIANNISGHDFQGSSMANARLIAAAPEMYQALLAFQAGLRDGSIRWAKPRQADSDPYHNANTLACEAIAKAEGKC